jgi:Na+/proline symporter
MGSHVRLFTDIVTAVLALAIAIAFMPFFWIGAGKTLAGFIPVFGRWAEALGGGGEGGISQYITDVNLAAFCFFALIAVYTVASGFYGVVYTDFIQAFLIFAIIVFFAIKAFSVGTAEYFAEHAPRGWFEIDPGAPVITPEGFVGNKSSQAILSLLPLIGPLAVFWIINNFLQGFATPFAAWTAQRYYAAKNEKEASLVAGQWISLLSLRWLLLPAIAVLALPLAAKINDPEQALAVVFATLAPGLAGLALAALLAAGMSTVDTTVNSCAAYYTSDLHKPYLRKNASPKELKRVSYLVSLVILVVGGLLGVFGDSIVGIWGWIIMGLFVGTLPPNIVKWFWWRANGWGFAGGCLSGLVISLFAVIPAIWTPYRDGVLSLFGDPAELAGLSEAVTFVTVFIGSAIGTVVVTLKTPPTDMETLEAFYRRVRPFGFWGPVRERVEAETMATIRTENTRDLWLLAVACLWQFSLFTLWGMVILKRWAIVAVVGVLLVATTTVLYKYWYRNLQAVAPEGDQSVA